MKRSTLLSACAAVSLLACQERPSGPGAGSPAPAAPPQAAAPAQAPAAAGAPAAAQAPAAAAQSAPPSAAGSAGAQDAGAGTARPSMQDAGSARCSASALSPEPKAVQPPLPPAVESMRRRIVAAAVACDYAALAALGREKGKDLSFTFGVAEDPAEYWREAEQQGEPVLAQMVKVLNLPYAKDEEGVFVWPSVHVTGLESEADWKSLRGLYPEEQLRNMREVGSGYLGLRVGISSKGDWQYAIAGD